MPDSKYQKILIDETPSATIPTAKANITVEEWYDMLHHSHPEFQNMSSGGSGTSTGGASQESVNALSAEVTNLSTALTELTAAVNSLSTLVQQQSVSIEDIIRINTEQTESINTMKSQIDKLEAYVDQDIQIDDGNNTGDAGAGEGSDTGDGPSLDDDDIDNGTVTPTEPPAGEDNF